MEKEKSWLRSGILSKKSNMIELRDYQIKAHEEIVQNFRKKEKVLLKMMAGGGKSLTVGGFIKRYQEYYKFVLIVRKRNLATQLAEESLKLFDLDYSIYMAGDKKLDESKRIQVCSKDTLEARNFLPFIGEDNVVIIIDECDEFPNYQRLIQKEYFSKSNRVFYLGMTATPFNGLDMYTKVIEPVTPKELLEMGVLIPFDYVWPNIIDYTDVGIEKGEFVKKDLNRKLNTPAMIADAFSKWLEFGEYRQTLVFCINKSHAKNFESYVNNYYGKNIAVHINADTPEDDREKVKQDFIAGRIKFIVVVGLFKRGTNIKEIGTILDLEPTLSLNNHIQKLGRGSRKNDFYSNCILIDFANNLQNLGHFYQDREVNLKSKYKLKKEDLEVLQMRSCKKCFRAFEPLKNVCPFCGYTNQPIKVKKQVISKYKKEKIFMQSASEEAIEQRKMIKDYKKILWIKTNLGKRYRHDIAVEKAQIDLLKKYGREKVLAVKGAIKLRDSALTTYDRISYGSTTIC